jgi:outer membrane protein assembly factor BamB
MKTNFISATAAAVALWLVFEHDLDAAQNWPQFRGSNCQGLGDSARPPVQFGPETNLVWKVEAPRGVSSPCVWGDRIFLTGVSEQKLVTLCLSSRDGKVLWKKPAPAETLEDVHKVSSPASATPATDGERVYVYFGSFGLLAYDFDGQERWRKPIPGLSIINGSGTSPALLNGSLVLNRDAQEGKSFLAAYEPKTGKERWRTPRPEFPSSYTTPVLWKRDGVEEIVVAGSFRVVGYGLADGREHWSAAGLEAVSVCPTPALGDGQVYVMSRSFGGATLPTFSAFLQASDKDNDQKISQKEAPRQMTEQGSFKAVDEDKDGLITEEEWDKSVAMIKKGEHGIFALRSPGQGDITETHRVWKHKRATATVSSPLFYRGRVYVVQDGGRVTCYDAKTGDKLYEQERLDAAGQYYASPVAADGHIYLASTRGTVIVIEAGDTLKIVAKNDLKESILATPAIVDNRLVVRAAEHLWAFGK